MNITLQTKKLQQALLSLCTIAILWGISVNVDAQVAIGLTEKPVDGALLQLKNIESITDGAANATKGMALPIVELTALNTLIIGGVDYNNEALEHIGLMVYNVKVDATKDLFKSPYMWDGEKWKPLFRKDWMVAPTSLYFYKSALVAKKLPVTGYVNNSDEDVEIAIHTNAGGTIDFNGAGAIFPASPHTQVSGMEEYLFKPVANTSGKTLSTNATFTATRSGSTGTASRTTRIIHYPYEFPIHISPNQLPANPPSNGIGAISIWSAADWKVSTLQPTDHDPDNILVALNLGEELRDQTPLMLDAKRNLTWNEKELKIDVESVGADGKHYEDFAPQTLTLRQAANIPTIQIGDPANKVLDFGLATTGSKNVVIGSNARWTATGAANIGDVIGSNTILGGAQHGVNSPALPINTTITLPVAPLGNDKAGTVYNSSITFSTDNHPPANAASTTLAVKKTTPLRWEYPTITPNANPLPRVGASFTAAVSTNSDWYRGAGYAVGGGTQLKTVAGYANESLSIPINNNDSWGPRDITAGLWLNIADQTLTTVQQLGYDLFVSNTNIGGYIGARANGNYYVQLGTNQGAPLGRIGINSRSDAGGAWILHPDTQGYAPHNQPIYFQIPVNTGAARELHFFYERAGLDWVHIGAMVQEAPVFHVVAADGLNTGTLTVTTDFPFMFCVGSATWGTTVSGGGYVNANTGSGATFDPGSTTTTFVFTITRNGFWAPEFVNIYTKITLQGGGVTQSDGLKIRRQNGHEGVTENGGPPGDCLY